MNNNNNSEELDAHQRTQEEEYLFPYHYIDLSPKWRLYQSVPYLSYLRIIKDLLRPFKGQTILDAGCGDGRLCYELNKENATIIGVDYSKKAVDFAKAFSPSIKFHVQDLRSLKLPENEFDQIVLMEVIEHIPPEDIPDVVQNLSNILKDDGIVVISTPTKKVHVQDKHFQHFDKYKLRECLKPYFKVDKEIGHYRLNFRRRIVYLIILTLGRMMLYPFKNSSKVITSFNTLISNYFSKYLESSKLEEAQRLIGVYRKVNC